MSETAEQGARAYHHGDLRKALLDAAREIVETEGVDAFTLRESARRAGVSHGAPAHHFGDKTGLLTEVAVQSYEDRITLSNAYMEKAGDDPMDRLKACGLAHIEYMIANPRLSDLCARPGLINVEDPAFQDVMARMTKSLIESMSAATGQALKPDKESNPSTLLALTVVHGFAALVNEGIILRDVPDAERPVRALALANEMMSLLEGAFRSNG